MAKLLPSLDRLAIENVSTALRGEELPPFIMILNLKESPFGDVSLGAREAWMRHIVYMADPSMLEMFLPYYPRTERTVLQSLSFTIEQGLFQLALHGEALKSPVADRTQKATTPLTPPTPFNPSSDPWLVVAPRNKLITWLGEPIALSSFKEHELDYFLALAHHAGEDLTCDEIAKFAKGAASNPTSLGPILCRVRRLLRPAVKKHSAELIGASPEAIKWEFIVCSPGREYKKRPRSYKLAIDPGRVRFVD